MAWTTAKPAQVALLPGRPAAPQPAGPAGRSPCAAITVACSPRPGSGTSPSRCHAPVPRHRRHLVIAGDRDRNYTPELFRETAKRIPGARLRLYPGKGHASIAILRYKPAVDEILGFLPDQPTPPPITELNGAGNTEEPVGNVRADEGWRADRTSQERLALPGTALRASIRLVRRGAVCTAQRNRRLRFEQGRQVAPGAPPGGPVEKGPAALPGSIMSREPEGRSRWNSVTSIRHRDG
jgi:hypothetical protein